MTVWAKWLEENQSFLFSDEDNGGVEITQQRHTLLMQGLHDGKAIVPDEHGIPVLFGVPAMAAPAIWALWVEQDQRFLFLDRDNGGVKITVEAQQELMRGLAAGKCIARHAEGFPVLVDSAVEQPSCLELCAQIDEAADRARETVAGDPLRAVEYQRAADEAQAFKDAGYPAEAVPPMVAAWAIGDRTAQQAADNILAEAAAYNAALVWLRATRLAAKEQIRALMEAERPEDAKALADETVANIQAAVQGVGNNGTVAAGGEQ
jgi:hypothetical protein